MYVDGHLPGAFGERHKVSGLPTMLFTATTTVPDVNRCLTMEAKAAGDLVYLLGKTGNELGGSEYYDLLGYVGLNVPQLDPQVAKPLYQALQGAVQEGYLASCRALHRGGLAVHAAMVAFAGELGMRLDLSAVPKASALRDDQILFSESCGRFLVTVDPSFRNDFEALFTGLPCSQVGEVTEDPNLIIQGQKRERLVQESISSLKKSWQQA
jgi:phosphoribosylformylglycinamidine synthase subunit PurSL